MRRLALLLCVVVAALAAAVALFPSQEAREIFAAALPEPPATATILFGGDMMFDRSVREYAGQYGGDYLFACLNGTLAAPDLVVANLEGPITDRESVSVGSAVGSPDNYTFTFPPSTAALLKTHHIGAVTLANNHIYNEGAAGVRSTLSYLDAAGVAHFGDPLSFSVADLTVGGVPIALIGYNDFIPDGGTASTTIAEVTAAKAQGRVPIVFAHWGVEYQPHAPQYVVALAHSFVDAGAAAVIGAHPHVVEDSEVYKGAPIYYSLGNLIFDQYWSTAVTHGLMVELSVSTSSATVNREVPVGLSRDRQTCPLP